MNFDQENCSLCNALSPLYYISDIAAYLKCPNCDGIFMSKRFLPTDKIEIGRYKTHNNDVSDPRYRNFVSPITNKVLNHFLPSHQGLDFGSGTGPVISTVLKEHDYQIEPYDPYFDNRPELLKDTYDYIACCEVVEHFHSPNIEFKKLRSLLNTKGKIFIKTDLFSKSTKFEEWYYKDDPTHVFFYSKYTFHWIKNAFNYKSVAFEGRLITLSN